MIFNDIALLKPYTVFGLFAMLFIFACSPEVQKEEIMEKPVTFNDPHSYSKPDEAVVNHLDLNLAVDFGTKTLQGKATYNIENVKGVDSIIFDIRHMDIENVTLGLDEEETMFNVGPEQEYLGRPLSIAITPDTKIINIYYTTRPEAAALQWLSPEQTAGKEFPFLFTQSQAILARTWVPTQDGPGVRFTYDATVKVPEGLMALMSATNSHKVDSSGLYRFTMKQPIPSYLLALAVGKLEFYSLGKRTGFYAEPASLEGAIYDLIVMSDMLQAAENLYGKYRWESYDVLVLPPSFPFGGMENPRLTFATPTIITGDRSLVSLVAHELAHSWSGNLVTNATWDDFWLNEGFTVYFERRIMEALEGKEYADMLEVLGYQDLLHEMEDLPLEDTRLKLELAGRDPDEGLTSIAYEKGYFLLKYIESQVGRERLDAFLKNYFNEFAFKSMTTESFLEYLKRELIKDDEQLFAEVKRWIYEPGLPESLVVVESSRFKQVDEMLENWKGGQPAKELQTNKWSTHEWLHFIRHLPDTLTIAQMSELDIAFGFTKSPNSEIQAAWYEHVIEHKYTEGYDELKVFLMKVGRRKFVLPLYKHLAKTEEGKKMALEIYKDARANYHAVTRGSVDEALGIKS